ncbi:hypothetical protein C8R43DRAFT_1136718 [Mycena crocata]|nr:hypothetical protein C8R43DRAFT_1136718 [Mycena crocata]
MDAILVPVLTMINLRSGLIALPSELRRMILFWACGCYFDDAVAFVRVRSAARFVCRQLNADVIFYRELWTSYILVPSKNFTELNFVSSRVLADPLDLRVYLHGWRSIFVDPRRAPFSSTLDFFLKHAHQCARLYFTADDFYTFPSLIDTLKSADLSMLEAFTLVRYPTRRPHLVWDRTAIDMPFTDPSVFDRMRSIRLFETVFTWPTMRKFGNLTELVLYDLQERLAPTGDELAALLDHNPYLIRLSLRLVSCSSAPSVHRPLVTLRHLKELDISAHGNINIGHILSTFNLPYLRVVSIVFSRRGDIEALMLFSSQLRPVDVFVARGFNYESPRLLDLLKSMPYVSILDISDFNREIFNAMLEQTESGIPVCPLLRTLALSEIGASRIKQLVAGRLKLGHRLAHLIVHSMVYGYDDDDEPEFGQQEMDMEWVRYYVGHLSVDPPSDPFMQWILR